MPSPVVLFDPGISTHDGAPPGNLGNLVIQDAVNRELNRLFADRPVVRISTFQPPELPQLQQLRGAHAIILGGTNMLTSRMREYRQWVISMRHAFRLRPTVLLGVGWWKYQSAPTLLTRAFLSITLRHGGWHSVRDEYTANMLRNVGIRNVLNTACVTMWSLIGKSPQSWPTTRGEAVLATLTDYAQSPEADQRLLNLLAEQYRNVYLWPQGAKDLEYIQTLQVPSRIQILPRTLDVVTNLLRDEPSLDYIGTRLHCGIHSLNHGRRTLILEVDNRATEISRDTNLPTCARDDFAASRAGSTALNRCS